MTDPIKQFIEKFEKEFFSRLADKLEELFPKTNQDHPEIPSEGNRTTALTFNAFANVIFRDILKKVVADPDSLWRERVKEIEEMPEAKPNMKGANLEGLKKLGAKKITILQAEISYSAGFNACRDQILKNLEELK